MFKDYKIVFLGNSSVGKTTLISQYLCSKIQDSAPTIAIDFLTTSYEVNGKQIKIQVWDTAGQEKFRSIVGNYVRNTFLAIIVFSLEDINSLERVTSWIEDFVFVYNNKNVKLMLVGNKLDCNPENLEQTIEKAKEIANKYNSTFVTASALTREGIKDMVDGINKLIEEDLNNSENSIQNIKNEITVNSQNTRRCC
jgi:Ras-related protein Rab-6A